MRVKRIFLGVFLLVISVVALAAAALFSGAISGDSLKPYIVDTAQDRLGYNIAINGEISYKLWPAPHVRVNDIVVDNGQTAADKLFQASVAQGDLYISLVDLLKGRFVVDNLKLNKPDVKMADVHAWQTHKISALMDARKTKAPKDSAGQSFALRHFEISDASLVLGYGETAKVFNALSLKLTQNLLLGHYDLNARVSHGEQSFATQMKVNIQDLAQKILGLDGTVSVQNDRVKLSGAGIFSWQDGLSYQGETRIDVSGYDMLAHISADKKAQLRTMLSVQQERDATNRPYKIQATDLQISSGQYKYSGSIKGRLMDGDKLVVLDADVHSNLDADIVLDSVVARILGNLSAKTHVEYSANTSLAINTSIDSLQHKFNIAFKHPEDAAAADIKINSPRLNVSEIYKKRQVVAKETKPLFDVYLEQGQDYFHGLVLDYIRKLPVLPYSNWDINLDSLTYQKNTLKNVHAKFAFDKSGNVDVRQLEGLYNGVDKIRLKGLVVNSDNDPRYNLELGFGIKKPYEILSYLPNGEAALTLRLSGDSKAYNWTGDVAVGKNILNFNALHKAQLPKDHASLLLLDIDAQSLSVFSDHQMFKQMLDDVHLNGAAKLQAQIGVLKDKSVEVDYLKGKIGNSALDVSGSAKFVAQKQEYVLKLKTDYLHYTPRHKQGNKGNTAGWSRKEITWPVASNIKANVDFDVAKLKIDQTVLSNVSGQLLLSDKTVTLNGLGFDAYGGSISASGGYKLVENGRLDASYKFTDVDFGALLKAIKKDNKAPFVEGRFSGDGAFQSTGRSTSGLIYGLNGSGKITGQRTAVNGVDLAKIGQVLRLDTKLENNLRALDDLMNNAMQKGQTVFNTVNIPYKISGGIIQLDDARFVADAFELWSKGQVLLTNRTLDIKNMITYKGDATEALPQVAFTVKGPFNAPVKDIASSVVQEFIRNKINRKLNKALNNVLQDLLPTQQQQPTAPANDNQQTEQQPQKQIDPTQLILKQILGQ